MRIDDLLLDELIRLHDIARENGYKGDYLQFKKDLERNPELIPLPPSAGPDFAGGGLVSLFRRLAV